MDVRHDRAFRSARSRHNSWRMLISLLSAAPRTLTGCRARRLARRLPTRRVQKQLKLDASAEGPGLREWFTTTSAQPHAIAIAFDTRLGMPASVTGRAARGIVRRLRRCGFKDVRDAGSFFVGKNNNLLPGEIERAAAWARAFVRDL